MKEELFRKKSIDKISSPDQLTDYIKVSNPGIWMVIAAVIILLAGTCVWGFYGRLETKMQVATVSDGNNTVCYVAEDKISSVKADMPVVVNDTEYKVSEISKEPIIVTDTFEDYILRLGNLQIGQWVYKVKINSVLERGIYAGSIILDSVSPLSFVFN